MSAADTMDPDLTSQIRSAMPFADVNDWDAIFASAERVVTAGAWQPRYCGIGGVLHGGYLMAMADGTGATLAFVNLAEGESTTTVESKTNFFRPITAGTFTATATIVHHGRTTMVVQTDITNETGALVARTTQTQAIRSKPIRSANDEESNDEH